MIDDYIYNIYTLYIYHNVYITIYIHCIYNHETYIDTRDKYDDVVIFFFFWLSDFILVGFCTPVFHKLASRKPKYNAKNKYVDPA